MNNDLHQGYTFFKTTVGVMFFVKLLVGVLLIIFASLAAVGILQIIYNILVSPEDVQLLEKIARAEPEGINIGTPGGDIEIPTIFFGYGVVIILLSISAGLAKGFLSVGVDLVKSDLEALLERLGEELARLWTPEKE